MFVKCLNRLAQLEFLTQGAGIVNIIKPELRLSNKSPKKRVCSVSEYSSLSTAAWLVNLRAEFESRLEQ